MAKSKKKVVSKKKTQPKKVATEVKAKKPTEVKAGGVCHVPYVPRKIDRVPPPKTK